MHTWMNERTYWPGGCVFMMKSMPEEEEKNGIFYWVFEWNLQMKSVSFFSSLNEEEMVPLMLNSRNTSPFTAKFPTFFSIFIDQLDKEKSSNHFKRRYTTPHTLTYSHARKHAPRDLNTASTSMNLSTKKCSFLFDYSLICYNCCRFYFWTFCTRHGYVWIRRTVPSAIHSYMRVVVFLFRLRFMRNKIIILK